MEEQQVADAPVVDQEEQNDYPPEPENQDQDYPPETADADEYPQDGQDQDYPADPQDQDYPTDNAATEHEQFDQPPQIADPDDGANGDHGEMSQDHSRGHEEQPRNTRNYDDEEEAPRNLYITNLHESTDESSLRAAFEKFGRIINVSVKKDPKTQLSRRFGFVKFENSADSKAACQEMNNQAVDGKTILVEFARRSRERTPTPGRYMGNRKFDSRGNDYRRDYDRRDRRRDYDYRDRPRDSRPPREFRDRRDERYAEPRFTDRRGGYRSYPPRDRYRDEGRAPARYADNRRGGYSRGPDPSYDRRYYDSRRETYDRRREPVPPAPPAEPRAAPRQDFSRRPEYDRRADYDRRPPGYDRYTNSYDTYEARPAPPSRRYEEPQPQRYQDRGPVEYRRLQPNDALPPRDAPRRDYNRRDDRQPYGSHPGRV